MTASLLAVMAAPDMPGGGLSLLLFQIVAIGLVFYFLILRPQSQARKKHEELLKNIKKDAPQALCTMRSTGVAANLMVNREKPPFDDPRIRRAMALNLAGGIIGKVKDVKEDRVTIESGSATLVIERARIIRIGDSAPAPGAAG